ncbi:hypothetical protein FPQ18DRAFT_132992 [Pyronema domesticum]|nr:hypothetical protein FPQ18DRAFT_132992 [Pyronema domesticum]
MSQNWHEIARSTRLTSHHGANTTAKYYSTDERIDRIYSRHKEAILLLAREFFHRIQAASQCELKDFGPLITRAAGDFNSNFGTISPLGSHEEFFSEDFTTNYVPTSTSIQSPPIQAILPYERTEPGVLTNQIELYQNVIDGSLRKGNINGLDFGQGQQPQYRKRPGDEKYPYATSEYQPRNEQTFETRSIPDNSRVRPSTRRTRPRSQSTNFTSYPGSTAPRQHNSTATTSNVSYRQRYSAGPYPNFTPSHSSPEAPRVMGPPSVSNSIGHSSSFPLDLSSQHPYPAKRSKRSFVGAESVADTETTSVKAPAPDRVCTQCDPPRTFPFPRDLKLHTSSKHGDRVICQICDESLASQYSLTRHMATKHSQGFPCGIGACNFVLGTDRALSQHQFLLHQQGNTCEHCGMVIARHKFNKHLTEGHKKGGHACAGCLEHFTSENSLRAHRKDCSSSRDRHSMNEHHFQSSDAEHMLTMTSTTGPMDRSTFYYLLSSSGEVHV